MTHRNDCEAVVQADPFLQYARFLMSRQGAGHFFFGLPIWVGVGDNRWLRWPGILRMVIGRQLHQCFYRRQPFAIFEITFVAVTQHCWRSVTVGIDPKTSGQENSAR